MGNFQPSRKNNSFSSNIDGKKKLPPPLPHKQLPPPLPHKQLPLSLQSKKSEKLVSNIDRDEDEDEQEQQECAKIDDPDDNYDLLFEKTQYNTTKSLYASAPTNSKPVSAKSKPVSAQNSKSAKISKSATRNPENVYCKKEICRKHQLKQQVQVPVPIPIQTFQSNISNNLECVYCTKGTCTRCMLVIHSYKKQCIKCNSDKGCYYCKKGKCTNCIITGHYNVFLGSTAYKCSCI
jgi:hypothetical protein